MFKNFNLCSTINMMEGHEHFFLLYGLFIWTYNSKGITLFFGEGNGNPLQCSCLENPKDGEAWWVAVYGVAELDTTEAT